MATQTKLSAKGQVVIPKDVRDQFGLTEGTVFDVFGRGDEIVLRAPNRRRETLTVEQATARIRAIVDYRGPRISDEEIASAAAETAAVKYADFVKRNGK